MQLLFFVMRYFYALQDDGWEQKTSGRRKSYGLSDKIRSNNNFHK